VPAYFREWLDRLPDLLSLAESFPGHFPYLLESASRGKLGGKSLLLFAGPELLVAHPGNAAEGPGSGDTFFEKLEDWYRQERVDAALDEGMPFAGGWFIYLGYEIAAQIETRLQLPRNQSGLPDALAHRCPGAILVEHGAGPVGKDRAMAMAETREDLEKIIDLVRRAESPQRGMRAPCEAVLKDVREEEPARFVDAVERIHNYLRAGDVFQVNISRPWTGNFATEPDVTALYESLRHANPAPFAGLMRWQQLALLSSSPERLVETRAGLIQTRPIAGTRPRGGSAEHDESLSRELVSNLKERAEHVMLIDLERNDLGRVCKPGSVEVDELMVVESYAHVHHIVSNVRGELRADASPVDAMQAVFPGGTITGCPKVRCMEIIAELESNGRGFYTGSMGYLGRHGEMDLNILIRSMLVDGSSFSFRTGAGIVADSVAEKEVQETADKARGMLLAVESHGKELKHA
jgi:anthranilate synthase component 1